MKPIVHATTSVEKYGGKVEDYLEIHSFMDSSKAAVPDMRHRCVFHSAFGIFIVERVFGYTITNSDGKIVSVRDVAEDHVFEDLGRIPTLQDWLSEMNFQDWMMSPDLRKKENAISNVDLINELEKQQHEELREAKRESVSRGDYNNRNQVLDGNGRVF